MNDIQMFNRCEEAVCIEEARLDNYEFYINNRGVANIRFSRGAIVEGKLWQITEVDECTLDRCEGANVAGKFYEKHHMDILVNNGSNIGALVYIDEYDTDEGVARDGYMETIFEGLSQSTISPQYIKNLWVLYGS